MSYGVWLSLVVVGGVAIGVLSNIPLAAGAGLSVVAAGCAAAAAGRYRSAARRAVWGVMAAAAMAWGAPSRDRALASVPDSLLGADGPVVITGRLRRDASIAESGVRLELEDVRVASADGRTRDTGLRVVATVGGELASAYIPEWTAGRRLAMPASVREPPDVRNPGAPSVRWQHLTRPFDAIANVKSALLINVTPASRWQEAAAAVRAYVRAVCSRRLVPLGSQSAAVTAAVLIGDRAGLDAAAMRRLQVAGTFHVIAISGGNVAILTALSLFAWRLFIGRGRMPVVVTLATVVAYGAVVGRDPSVMRAVVAAVMYLSLRLAGVPPRPVNVLALTALVCALIDPRMVVDVGAWLSFGATLGLIAILPHLAGGERATRPRGTWHSAWRAVRALLLATAAAELMILPVSASVFMRVGVTGLVLNLIAIPAMTVVQVAGLLLCLLDPLGGWCDGLAGAIARAGHAATSTLVGSASLVDVVPWLVWRVPPPPLAWTIVYYAALLVATIWPGPSLVRRMAAGAVLISAVTVVVAPWTYWSGPPAGWARITMIDVGQGEAIAVQVPGRRAFLVDAGGSAGSFDVGGRVVTPALWASGIRRLDWLVVTHADVDHAGGALRVSEDLRPREIWEGIPVPGDPVLAELRAAADREGIAWRQVRAGDRVELGGVAIDVLHPPVPDWERRKVRNDDSVVLRLRIGLVEVLLTGDAGSEFEASVPSGQDRPPIRILKAGHHGSATSTSRAFLDAYRPAIAAVSAGRGNLFGHPSAVVLDRLRQHHVDVVRTDRDGAIVIETDGRVARIRTATGRSLTVSVADALAPAWLVSPVARPLPFRP